MKKRLLPGYDLENNQEIIDTFCPNCGDPEIYPLGYPMEQILNDERDEVHRLYKCPKCGAYLQISSRWFSVEKPKDDKLDRKGEKYEIL